MITDYKKAKNDVLKQYDSIMPLIQEIKGDSETTYDSQLAQLEMDVDNIRKNIFRLMVVGEAKSGKSTFINAYLGKEILPMDVKQCTSAIVEIRYGQKFVLHATYADGRKSTISDEEEIRSFLKKNAALDDEYRDIPVGTINLQLIIPNKGKRIAKSEIDELLKIVKNDNYCNLPQDVYNRKIVKYVEKKNLQWQDVVQKIEIEYPFEDEDLKGIQIVDTPGVGAEGRVGEITEKYITSANAVMFLKPIVGAALESTSFKNFLKKTGKDKTPDTMFLILTRAANETPGNVGKVIEDAQKQFTEINKKQIIKVDSKVELFRNKVKEMTEEELQEFMKERKRDKICYLQNTKGMSEEEKAAFLSDHQELDILDSFLYELWSLMENRDGYLSELKELSNFGQIDDALNQFARKAQYLLLSDALGRMISILEKIKSELSENIEHYKQKAVNPAELERKLLNIAQKLEDLKGKINGTVAKIRAKYTESNGIIEKKTSEIIEEYKSEMGKINPESETGVSELERLTFRIVNEFNKLQEEITKNIVDECDKALVAFSQKGDLNYTSLKPDITPEVLDKVKAEKYNQAKETYTKGVCFKETHEKLNQSKYFHLVSNDIKRRLQEISDDVSDALREYTRKVTSAYRGELKRNSDIQTENYRIIREDKANAEKIQEKIKSMESMLHTIQPKISELDALKGGIDKNVR